MDAVGTRASEDRGTRATLLERRYGGVLGDGRGEGSTGQEGVKSARGGEAVWRGGAPASREHIQLV